VPTPKALDVLADVEALLSYTPAYRRVEVLDRYDDGRPHRVRLAARVLGRLDEETVEFR
jgi:hypothetical protein